MQENHSKETKQASEPDSVYDTNAKILRQEI